MSSVLKFPYLCSYVTISSYTSDRRVNPSLLSVVFQNRDGFYIALGRSGCGVWGRLTHRGRQSGQGSWTRAVQQESGSTGGWTSPWLFWFFSVPLSVVGYYSRCTWTRSKSYQQLCPANTFLILYLESQKGLAYGWMHLFNFWSLLFVPHRIPGHIVQCTFLMFFHGKSHLYKKEE